MSSISLCLGLPLFMVLIGSLPCESNDCNRDTVDKCRSDNLKMPQECLAYNKTIQCLEKLLPKCTDDVLIEEIVGEVNADREQMAKCPGFEDGVCFYSFMSEVCGTPSYLIEYGDDEETKRKACIDFKSKSSHMRTCTKSIKTRCVDKEVLNYIDDSVGEIDTAEKTCADYV